MHFCWSRICSAKSARKNELRVEEVGRHHPFLGTTCFVLQSKNEPLEQLVCPTAHRRTTGTSVSVCHITFGPLKQATNKRRQIRNRQCGHSGHRHPKKVHNKEPQEQHHRKTQGDFNFMTELVHTQSVAVVHFPSTSVVFQINWSNGHSRHKPIWIGGERPALPRHNQLISASTVVMPQRALQRPSQKQEMVGMNCRNAVETKNSFSTNMGWTLVLFPLQWWIDQWSANCCNKR